MAGVDTCKVGAYSCRDASTSAAKRQDLSLGEIMETAGWFNVPTGGKYYDK